MTEPLGELFNFTVDETGELATKLQIRCPECRTPSTYTFMRPRYVDDERVGDILDTKGGFCREETCFAYCVYHLKVYDMTADGEYDFEIEKEVTMCDS